jgi:predicted PurR-regulated permease PerM
LLGRRFTLNPVIIFVSLIFWTWVWGVPGALLSVPILVSIKVVCERLPSLSHLSELLTSESNSIFDNLKLLRLRKQNPLTDSSDPLS